MFQMFHVPNVPNSENFARDHNTNNSLEKLNLPGDAALALRLLREIVEEEFELSSWIFALTLENIALQ